MNQKLLVVNLEELWYTWWRECEWCGCWRCTVTLGWSSLCAPFL